MLVQVNINGNSQTVNIDLVPKNEDGSPVKNLLDTMTDGVYDIDTIAEATEAQAKLYSEWKVNRQTLVDGIVVTYNGAEYQGDEKSQDRMSRAINGLLDTDTIEWVAKDNSIVVLTKDDLVQILRLAGAEQATIWNAGRPEV